MNDGDEHALFARAARAVDPGATLRRVWPLKGGISSRMTALEVERADGAAARFVVRRPDDALRHNPDAAAHEFRLLQGLQTAGLPTPAPLLLDASGAIFPMPYLVIGYIDGAPEAALARQDDVVAPLAAQLARIHATDWRRLGLTFLPAHTPHHIHQRTFGPMPETLPVGPIRAMLAQRWPAQGLRPSVLLHGDFWVGNVLWKRSRITGVIDWEEARIGNPFADLAITRLEMLWTFGSAAMDEFTRHYLSLVPLEIADLPYWDLDAALRPVFNIGDWAAGWPDFGRPDITEATLRAGHAQFVDQALAKLAAR